MGEIEQKTKFIFTKVSDFETYNNSTDVGYDSVVFTGRLLNLNTPKCN